ncbi:hypothetical protein FACS1894181_10890 [Bacteroidia bacterium]|nr:hypothetical protein FACS1894181_10890 [Bacteroidia bacterium]
MNIEDLKQTGTNPAGKTCHKNIINYYQENPQLFEKRTSVIRKAIYGVLALLCLVLLIMPGIAPAGPLITRILAGIGLFIFAISAWYGGEDYYNRASGGKIKDFAIKKFDDDAVDETEIVGMFEANDFAGLADAPGADNMPLQLYIEEDKKGRVFYCLLKKYFSTSDFRGITSVKVIAEPEYSKLYPVIKSIRK